MLFRSIHFRGGSDLGISRANPTKDVAKLDTVLDSLERLNVDKLISIGGDDTAFSAYSLEKRGQGRVKVAHVPKTIDNDLDLPPDVPTFGFQTARHLGDQLGTIRLLGAEGIVVGIGPAVAVAFLEAEADLSRVRTLASLREAIELTTRRPSPRP